MIVEDEVGFQWLVLEGDPSYTIVDKLKDKGMRYIAITRECLQTGSFGAFREASFDPHPALKTAAELGSTVPEAASVFLAQGKRRYQIRQAFRIAGGQGSASNLSILRGGP